MPSKKSFVIPLIIAIIVLAIVGGVYLYNTYKNCLGCDRDVHGCIGSAGYSWCAVKNKCLRVWEEKCEVVATTTLPISTSTNPIACTMDAKQCPDGSWVGRTGLKCEFVCSTIIDDKKIISVLSPDGGEKINIGEKYIVKWWDDRDAGNRSIYIINQSTGEIRTLIDNVFMRSSGIDGNYYYEWTVVDDIVSGNYKLKICKSDVNECDLSDNYFTIN